MSPAMHFYVIPVIYALFAWWLSTGIIIYLDGLPQHTLMPSFAFLTLILFLALVGSRASRADTSISGAYLSFTCGIMVWGWQVAGFYMGFVSGPRRHACPLGCRGIRHFRHAIEACLYHELVAILGMLVLLAISWQAPNQLALQTYLILWGLHELAKLNVFFGVRNLNEEFLPNHMRYLSSFFSRKPINLFFPVAITMATILTGALWQHTLSASASVFTAVGGSFLGCMAALGLLELWLLVLPLPLHLWDWSLSSHRVRLDQSEIKGGFASARD